MKLRDSPFLELGCPFTAYEALKMLLLLPWVPLRLCLGGAALVALAVINSAAAWGVPPDQPLPAWRRNVVLASKELVGVVLWALGFRVRVAGRRHLQQALQLGAVGVFNHASWVDAFLLVWLMAPSGVSKADNAQLPVIGSAVRALQTVFIPYEKLSKQRRAGGASVGANGGSRSSSSCSSSSDSLAGDSSAAAATQPATAAAVAGASGPASDPSPGLGVSSAGLTGFAGAVAEAAAGEAASRHPATASAVLQQRRRQTASAASKHTTGSSTGKASTLLGHAGADAGGGAKASKDCSNGRASSSSSSSGSSAFIVQGNVTEVLLQRVRHPSYCRPGGYPIVVMAPEGTTANGRGLLRFRTGAFVLGRPVLPICIKYRFRGANPAWTMGDARWTFLRLMCQWRNDVEVTLLPPLQPSEQELREPALFAARVRSAMAACLQVPLVDACHDHYLALRRAGLRGVSWDGRRLEAEPGAPLWRLCERRQPGQEQEQGQGQEQGQEEGQGQKEGPAGVEHPAGPGACGVAGGGEGAATGSDAGNGRGGGGDEGARRQPLGPGGRACVPLEELEMADVLALAAQLEA